MCLLVFAWLLLSGRKQTAGCVICAGIILMSCTAIPVISLSTQEQVIDGLELMTKDAWAFSALRYLSFGIIALSQPVSLRIRCITLVTFMSFVSAASSIIVYVRTGDSRALTVHMTTACIFPLLGAAVAQLFWKHIDCSPVAAELEHKSIVLQENEEELRQAREELSESRQYVSGLAAAAVV